MKSKSKIKKYIIILFILLVITIPLSNFTEDISTKLIVSVLSIFEDKTASHNIIYDNSGVPIVDYGYTGGVFIGEQRNPITISQQAFAYEKCYRNGNKSCMRLFLNSTDWLVENAVQYDNFTVWEYDFPWTKYNMTPPWRSGMAQGHGIQALSIAYNLTGDERYLKAARSALNSFYVEIEEGGVTIKEKDGWWYEEYADEEGTNPKVLNGMIFALIGIHEYYKVTGDENAKYLFDKGIIALKNNLANYDAGGWSYYDSAGNLASKNYHQIHVEQLSYLYNITKDPTFKHYHDTWKNYTYPQFFNRFMKQPSKLGVGIIFLNFFALLILFKIFVLLKGRLNN